MKSLKSILTVLLFLGFMTAQQNQEIKLLEVSVEGNILTSENTILFTSGLRKGLTITATEFQRGIKRLWNLGLFQNIQLRYDDESPEGLTITIIVEENPILGALRFEGNKKIKNKKFDEELDLTQGQRIRPNTLHETSKRIKQLYAEKGYLQADVSTRLIKPEETSTLYGGKAKDLVKDVIFTIEENGKVKIGNIIFEGNHAFTDLRLRFKMKETKRQRWYLFWRSTFDEKKYNEDLDQIQTFYRNKGYRDFKILKDTIQFNPDRRRLDLVVSVDEGPQYKYRNFTWEGYTLFNKQVLSRALAIQKGDRYSEEDFNLAVFDRVQGLYMDRGYIWSRIEPKITPVGEDSLDVHFMITENHKVYVNHIVIRGNTRTRENVIRRQLRIFPGDVFNRDRLIRSQREVWLLNFFSNVVPDVAQVDEDHVDIEITVEEKPAGQANANMGFTQTYGVMGGGGLALPNFRGKGQSLNVSFNVGTNYSVYGTTAPSKYESASLSFTDPMVNDTKNLLGASIFYTFRGSSSMYYSPLNFTLAGGALTWGRIFKWPDDFFRGTWSFQIVRKMYEGSEADLERYTGGMQQTDGINITQTIRRDSRDRPEFTTLGSVFSLKSTLAGGFLGGNEDFHKHILNLEYYTPTFWKFVLRSSLKLGIVKPLPSYDEERSIIPFDERFIMGGNGIPYGNPLRGYDDNRVGPLTSSGSPIGGDAMVKINTEFRVPFSENPVVYGLVFAEMGNVWSSPYLMERFDVPRQGPLDLKRSAGAGIRFFMPMIGMLGFDIGYGFDHVENGERVGQWKTTITFGQQF